MCYLNERSDWDGTINDDLVYICESGCDYVLDFKIPGSIIKVAYHPGDCDKDVAWIMEDEQIRAQLDSISDERLNEWWSEFFCDDTDEEHRGADREERLSWALFDACVNALDGYCYEAE